MSKKISPTLTILALAISAFGIGSAEFISVGIMPMLVKNFGISLDVAGLTVSLYAFGVMIGAPILAIITGKIQRKQLLIGIMVTFIIGNLLDAFAPIFSLLLFGRIITAFAHGLFMSIATVIAADVVAPEKRASSIAMLFTGLTVATITGVPLGTFIGKEFGWQWSFIFITIVGLIALIADAILVPAALPLPAPTNAKGIIRIITQPKLLLALVITALGYGGTFVAYTYISTILESSMGWSASAVVIILIIYGVMVAIGNTLGGRFANLKPLKAIMVMFISLFAALIFLQLVITQHWLGLIAVLLMGLFAFMNVPGLQLIIVQLAEKHTPNDINLASALNIAGFNLGIMVGSSIGGQVITHLNINLTPIFGAGMVLAAILFLLWLMKLERKE